MKFILKRPVRAVETIFSKLKKPVKSQKVKSQHCITDGCFIDHITYNGVYTGIVFNSTVGNLLGRWDNNHWNA